MLLPPKPGRTLTLCEKLIQQQTEEARRLRLTAPPGVRLSGFEDPMLRNLLIGQHTLREGGITSLKRLLPLLLQLKGKPYTLDRYFPFEPFFRTRVAKKTLLKTGRQVSKSTSLAAQGILQSATIPYFSTLFVTPLFEMVRRFSQNYVRPFIETSPMRRIFSGAKTINSVLQRSFTNRSSMQFSFAFLDAERTRGIAADKNAIDEVQEMDIDFLPIIHETMSGSDDWGLIQYAGTPKSFENALEALWGDSSQAEWMIRCPHGGCGHWNVPALSHDLIEMIGPARDDVCDARPGVVCAMCRKPVDPRRGRWVHAHPERRWAFAGYHVPQIIMPMHYGNPEKWATLVGKMHGRGNTPQHVFFNEVCGESFDTGSKLVTLTDLKAAACLPWRNRVDEARARVGEYAYRVLSVDWGGNGEKGISYTVLTVMGMRPDGKIDALWSHRILRMLDYEYEAKMIIGAMHHFRCSHFVHDYNGSGSEREALVCQGGFPLGNIMPIRYAGNITQNIMVRRDPTDMHPRFWYALDKSRSLQLTCHCIRNGLIRFFQDDHVSSDEPGMLRDFLALREEKTDSMAGPELYRIVRNPKMPDDFAQTVNFGACALWWMSEQWPDLASTTRFRVPAELISQVQPVGAAGWDDV